MSGKSYPDLRSLWYLDDKPEVRCCVCSKIFSESDALVRTFRVFISGTPQHQRSSSEVLQITGGHYLALCNRHMNCLLGVNVEYVTVSHVWHTGISTSQNKGLHSPQDPNVSRLVWSLPTNIAQNISKALGRDVEVWHDYISVPQVRL